MGNDLGTSIENARSRCCRTRVDVNSIRNSLPPVRTFGIIDLDEFVSEDILQQDVFAFDLIYD